VDNDEAVYESWDIGLYAQYDAAKEALFKTPELKWKSQLKTPDSNVDKADGIIKEHKRALLSEMERKRGRTSSGSQKPSNFWRKRRWRKFSESEQSSSVKDRFRHVLKELKTVTMVM